MSINSYAQNFEDVMLWRALGGVKDGFYIDIGAQHPVLDSVSKAFYEHGWRGIHLEATPAYAALLRQDRPDELVIQAAVTDQQGMITFYEIPETGISTGDKNIAEGHRERGFSIKEISVPCLTLKDILSHADGREIHWLKIDVEGMEYKVLNSWGASKVSPWIVIVESTLPLTQTETYDQWQAILLKRGYQFVYFDGLNRFYISQNHLELASAFKSGPNVFDGFTLNGTACAPFCQRLNETHHQAEESLRQQLDQVRVESIRLEESLNEQKLNFDQQRKHGFEKERALTGLLNQTSEKNSQEAIAYLNSAIRREQEFTVQLLAGKEQLQQLEQTHGTREKQLQEQLQQAEQQSRQKIESQLSEAMRCKQEFTVHLLASKDQLLQLEQAHRAREQQLQEQLVQVEQQTRQEIEAQLRTAMQREKEFTTQLLAGKEQFQQLEQAHCAREKQLQEQLAQAEQQARQESEGQLRQAILREQEFTAQLLAGKDQLQQLANEHAIRDSSLRDQLIHSAHQFRRESEAQLRNAVEREQAVSAQQLALQQQAAQDLAQQARELQLEHDERRLIWELQEKALRQEVSNLTNEVHALRHDNELKTQQHGLVMDAHLGEQQRLIEAYAALEARFKAEIAAEQQTSSHLRQVLAEVQQALVETYASLSWRLTAPFRAVFFFFVPKQSGSPTIAAVPSVIQHPVSQSTSINIQGASPEPIMLLTSANHSNMSTTVAITLDELLAYHDQSFVVCAYQTLLGRAPDPEGLGYYLGRLRTGIPKIQLLAQLRLSSEGQAHGAKLLGLDAAIRCHQRGQYPLIGGLLRRLNGGEGNHPTERKLRGIENQLFLLSNDSNRRFDQLETALAGLQHLIVQQTQSVVTALGGISVGAMEGVSISPSQSPLPDGLKQLTPRAKDVYFQLKAAAARHAVRVA